MTHNHQHFLATPYNPKWNIYGNVCKKRHIQVCQQTCCECSKMSNDCFVGGNDDTPISIDAAMKSYGYLHWSSIVKIVLPLLHGGEWMNNLLINAGQRLLKEANPYIGGLQSTNLGQVLGTADL